LTAAGDPEEAVQAVVDVLISRLISFSYPLVRPTSSFRLAPLDTSLTASIWKIPFVFFSYFLHDLSAIAFENVTRA